ncbi:hypothetical protein T484DRAFT_1888149, partial [Baffinella frigidus]
MAEERRAALVDGAIKCWGNNYYGELGYGYPGADAHAYDLGDRPGEMGTNLPALELGGTAVAIAAGDQHNCALLVGGFVKCWGYNG